MLNLKFDTLRATAYKANLPENNFCERYNLAFSHRLKDGSYANESWLVELPKGTVLKDRTRIEFNVKDMMISNGYSLNKKVQYAPILRIKAFKVIQEPSEVEEKDEDFK